MDSGNIPEQVPENKSNKIALLLIIIALFAVYWRYRATTEPVAHGASTLHTDLQTNIANTLFIGETAKVHGTIPIPLTPMAELNFRSKHDIFELRRKLALQHPELTGNNYQPSESVFGQIIDNKPWWGLYGIFGFGPGQKSIEGPSVESRFYLNPFMLIGVREPNAYINSQGINPADKFYAEPINLNWNSDHRTASVMYNVSGFFNYLTSHNVLGAEQRKVEFVAYNARDFGFNYLWIDPSSLNIDLPDKSKNAIGLAQFIHCGGSCGYPGGCNNVSPLQPQLIISVQALPAKVYIKLWRQAPKEVDQDPDFVFLIEMI